MAEKFVSPCPPPTPRQRETLEIIAEEAAEVIQRATKALRFGVEEIQPDQKHPYDNSERLAHEIGDLMGIVDLAVEEGLLDGEIIEQERAGKRHKLAKYMQTEAA